MENKAFYMIYAEGANSPTRKHDTIEAAEKEAKRLAEITGKETFVLCSVKSYKLNNFIETDLIPFKK